MTSSDANTGAHGLRRRRITRTVASGFIAKAAMFLPTLAIARVVVPVLGPERFGVLMTILSLLAFLAIADLGVGSSLVTLISRAVGAGQTDRVRQLQANGLVAVSCMAALLLVVALAVFYIDVGSLIFPASAPPVRTEATHGLAVFCLLFALSLPLTLVSKIQLGLQRGHLANYWQTATAIVNFICGVLAARHGLSIPWIVAAMMTGTLVCGLANMSVHYWRNPLMRPVRGDVTGTEFRSLLAESSFFLALQVIFVIAYAADTAIVARTLGAQQASVYALSERLFSIVAVAVGVITAPLWAAYGEAFGARDWDWGRRVLRLSTTRIAVAAFALSFGILALLNPLIRILSSGKLSVPITLALAMAGWRVIEAIGGSLSVYMFASQSLRFVLITGAGTALVSLVAKLLILPHTGLFAMPLIMGTCYLLLCLFPTLYHVRRAHHPVPTWQ